MLNFLQDLGTYDQRKVERFSENHLTIDTARVSDGKKPYETAVAHPDYNGGNWIIVEAYDTVEEAQTGHKRWVDELTKGLPPVLHDCANAGVASLIVAMDDAALTFHRTVPVQGDEVKHLTGEG